MSAADSLIEVDVGLSGELPLGLRRGFGVRGRGLLGFWGCWDNA